MRLAFLFLVLAAAMAGLAFAAGGGVAWLWLWPAASFAAVGAGYAGVGARVLGKRPDGTRSLWVLALFAPYFALAWLVVQALRASRVPPHAKVADRLYVGRRPIARELPAGVDLVVDLTAELSEPRDVRVGRRYVALPTLDASVPDRDAFLAVAEQVAAWPGTAYVHCAAGHGRSAALVATVLMLRGEASDLDGAHAALRRVRPGVSLNAAQSALVRSLEPRRRRRPS